MEDEAEDEIVCWACGYPVVDEYHHCRPKRDGGDDKNTIIVPLCKSCHDMIDRKPLDKWPIGLIVTAAYALPREAKLLLLKIVAVAWDIEVKGA